MSNWSRARRLGSLILLGLAMFLCIDEGAGQPAPGSGRWTNIGPAPIVGGQVGIHGHERPVVGRVSAIATNPDNDRHWLVGGALGGVWETRDGGRTWAPLTDGESSLAMGAITFAPANSNVVYAGTGEALAVAAGFPGRGLLRLTRDGKDGGWSIEPVSRHASTQIPFRGLGFSDIKVDPKNSNHLVVATRLRSTPDFYGGRLPDHVVDERGIVELGPQSFQQHLWGDATSLEVHPDPDRFGCMYAGLTRRSDFAKAPTIGVYRRRGPECGGSNPTSGGYQRRTNCTDQSSSDLWTRISGPWDDDACELADQALQSKVLDDRVGWSAFLGRVELAIARNPNVVYVSIASRTVNDSTDNVEEKGSRLLGLWKTTNAWDTNPDWVKIPTHSTDGGSGEFGYCGAHAAASQDPMCYWSHVLSVDPADENVVYTGGIGLWRAKIRCHDQSPKGVLDSKCVTWTDVSHTSAPAPTRARLRRRGIHVDQHAMAWTATGSRLVVGNDGGVWSTTDRGRSWAAHNSGLSVVQFYRGAIVDSAGGTETVILGGTQDNGTVRWAEGAWEWVLGGDGGASVIDPRNPRWHWAVTSESVLYGKRLRRTRDGGKEFTFADAGLPPLDNVLWMPLAACEHAGDTTLLAGARHGLWKSPAFFSHRATPTWTPNFSRFSSPPGAVSAIAFAPSVKDCTTYAFGTTEGRVYVTTNGGKGWCELTGIPRPPQALPSPRRITGIGFHIADPSKLSVSMWETAAQTADTKFGRVYSAERASCPATVSGARSDNAGWVDQSLPAKVPTIRGDRPADERENIRTLAVHPLKPDSLWIGTNDGVWVSTGPLANGQRTWIRHNNKDHGMPNVAVFDIQISPKGYVVAFTYGRGAFLWQDDGWCNGARSGPIGANFRRCPSQ